MREVCEQCRRVVQSWSRPVISANRAFCSEGCAEDYREIREHVFGAQQPAPTDAFAFPAADQMQHLQGNAW